MITKGKVATQLHRKVRQTVGLVGNDCNSRAYTLLEQPCQGVGSEPRTGPQVLPNLFLVAFLGIL